MSTTASHANAPVVIELRAGRLRLALRPDLGGAVAGLWCGEHPVLRSTEPAALEGPRQAACYPLVPYSNRLGDRRFQWRGVEHTTAANFDDSPHSLHGVGWLRPWHTVAAHPAAATLRYEHRADAHWPFAFCAEQHLTLSAQALHMTLRVTNTSACEQPVGLGWHPYFPLRAASHLRMAVTQRWHADARQLPTHAVPQDGLDAAITDLDVDHCFTGWQGPAVIEDEHLRLHLTSTLHRAVVFTPRGRPFFCVEPVSHVNNALQQADPLQAGVVSLAPGACTEASMTLQVERRS